MYYVSELHMGDVPGDGYELIDYTDMFGPFKSLSKARKVFKEKICKDDNSDYRKFLSLGFPKTAIEKFNICMREK